MSGDHGQWSTQIHYSGMRCTTNCKVILFHYKFFT